MIILLLLLLLLPRLSFSFTSTTTSPSFPPSSSSSSSSSPPPSSNATVHYEILSLLPAMLHTLQASPHFVLATTDAAHATSLSTLQLLRRSVALP
jgi:hypothetical protein